jgi:hypothetical protein
VLFESDTVTELIKVPPGGVIVGGATVFTVAETTDNEKVVVVCFHSSSPFTVIE